MLNLKFTLVRHALLGLGVALLLPVAANAAENADLAAGTKLYESACIACHSTGAAGAPTLGDKAAWQPFFETGLEKMVAVAIKGNGGMPPRGGTDASDSDIRSAVQYIMSTMQ